MSFLCGQCGMNCFSESGLKYHLHAAHGMNMNPVPRSLANLYEVVEGLEKRLDKLEGRLDLVEEAVDGEDDLDE